jgi:hypothetical protein
LILIHQSCTLYQTERVLGMFYNYELCTYAGFTMVVLQQTWFWRFWWFFQT